MIHKSKWPRARKAAQPISSVTFASERNTTQKDIDVKINKDVFVNNPTPTQKRLGEVVVVVMGGGGRTEAERTIVECKELKHKSGEATISKADVR